jgi:hypothetical protein
MITLLICAALLVLFATSASGEKIGVTQSDDV